MQEKDWLVIYLYLMSTIHNIYRCITYLCLMLLASNNKCSHIMFKLLVSLLFRLENFQVTLSVAM